MSQPHDATEAEHLDQVADVRITITMTPREAYNFMHQLSTDDALRARIQANPHEVLAEYGIHVPSRAIPLQASLPPKDQLQQLLIDITAGRESTLAELPFNVDPMYWMFIDFFIFLARMPIAR